MTRLAALRAPAIALVFLFASWAAQATASLAHVVEFEGHARPVHLRFDLTDAQRDASRLRMMSSPQLVALQRRESQSFCSAGSYLVGRWRIEGNQLYFLHAFGCGPAEHPVERLYPGQRAPLKADWVDAEIELHDGELLCEQPYVRQVHRTHLILTISKGIVTGIERRDMRDHPWVPPPSSKDRWCLG
jgi:hypothetical protein